MEDVLGADETGINVIPRATRTLAPQGSRQVPGLVKKALAQITKVTCITLLGGLLGYQLIFGGKTSAVFPSEVNPAAGSFYSSTPSHFANASTTLEFCEKIILPFIDSNRRRRIAEGKSSQEQEDRRWAVLIWDNFSAHKDEKVQLFLAKYRIKSMFLPPNCTSIYQALDVMFNGNEKQVLRAHFSEWHFETLRLAMARDPNIIDVLPKTAAKKRALIATLIRGVHEIMQQKKDLICRAWDRTGLYDKEVTPDLEVTIDVEHQLVREMVRLTLEKDEENTLMAIDDEEDLLPKNDVEVPAEYGIHDLNEGDYQQEDEPDVNEEDVADDTDDESYAPPGKRSLQPQDAAAMDDAASDSAETSIMVGLERADLGKSIQVTFLNRKKPTASQVLQKLIQNNCIASDTTIVSTFDSSLTGYKISLDKGSHGSIAKETPSLLWFPHELE